MRTFVANAEDAVDGFNPVGAGTLLGCLEGVAATDDSTTYIDSTKALAYATMGIETVATPALFTNHKVRFRVRRHPTIDIDPPVSGVVVVVGGVDVYTSPDSTPSGSWVSYEYDLGLVALLSDYSDISVRLEDRGGVAARRVRFTAVDFQVGNETAFSGSGTATISQTAAANTLESRTASATLAVSETAAANTLESRTASATLAVSETAAANTLESRTASAALTLVLSASSPVSLEARTGSGTITFSESAALSASAALVGSASLIITGAGVLGGIGYIRNLFGLVRQQIESTVTCQVVHDNEPDLDDSSTRLRMSIASMDVKLLGWSGSSLLLRYLGVCSFEVSAAVDKGEKGILDTYLEILNSISDKTIGNIRYRAPRIVAKHRDESRWTLEGAFEFQTDNTEVKLESSPGRPAIDAAASALRTRFRSEVAVPVALQVLSDNEPMSVELETRWSRFSWKVTESKRVDQVTNRSSGIVEARLFCKVDEGDARLLDLIQRFLDNMKCVTVAGVTLSTPSIRTVGRRGTWWQLNVSCPFFFDTTVS